MENLAKIDKIKDEINRILDTEEIIDENCNSIPLALNPDIISIYDVYNVVSKRAKEFETLKEDYDDKLNFVIKNQSYESSIVFYGMDFENDELSIGFNSNWRWGIENYKHITFSKRNNKLYIVRTETHLYAEEVFELLKDTLSNAYDEFIPFKDFELQGSYNIRCFNSNLLVFIDKFGVRLSDGNSFSFPFFTLNRYVFQSNYSCDSKYDFILNTIKDKEENIFKKTFVNIEDCPEWMKETLYKIRKEQIDEKLDKKETANKIDENKEFNNIDEKKSFKTKVLSLFKK